MKLSIAMIVRDEENNIKRALGSALDVADEIVILDTGSVDKTKEIIQSYNNPKIKLFDHEWENHFSFYIADEFYPAQYLFNSIGQAVDMLTNESYDSTEYRRFAEEHNESGQVEKVMGLVREVMGGGNNAN